MKCLHCSQETLNPKFCSRSCAASYNNKGIRRHGKSPNLCKVCGNLTSSYVQIYCTKVCFGKDKTTSTQRQKAMNSMRQSRYRAKKLRVLAPDADKEKIKQIYLNCPEGFEVDHIIPVSKGGLHHESNLQYLPIIENRKKNNRIVT